MQPSLTEQYVSGIGYARARGDQLNYATHINEAPMKICWQRRPSRLDVFEILHGN